MSVPQRRFLIYGGFVGAAGVAAIVWQAPRIAWSQWAALLALAILAVAARRYAFTVGGLVGISLDTGVHFASIIIVGPASAALIALVSTIIGLIANPVRRYQWLWPRLAYVGFNGGMFALMQHASGAVYAAIGGPRPTLELLSLATWLAALAWVVAYHLVNLLIAYPALFLSRRLSWDLVRHDPSVFATEAATLPVGVVLIVVYNAEGLAGLALLGGLLIIASALLQQLMQTGDRLRGQLNSAAALTEAGQALAASLDADQVVELVAELATKVLNARTFYLALYDEAQQELYFPVMIEQGARGEPIRAAFEPNLGLTAHVITTRKPVLINSAAEFEALPIRRNPASSDTPIESALAVPMIARERVLGVVSVQSTLRQAFSQDDLGTLSTLAQQAAIAIDNAALVRNLAAQERLRQELEIARRTQSDLLPAASPCVDGWDIAGASSPASVVGGDLFGYYESRMSTGQVAVAVGDVSGHGMPAALLMTLTVGLLGAESRSSDSAAQVLSHLDTALRPHCLRSRLNVAVCYAILHRDGTVRIANAGGIAPLVRWSEGRVEWLDAHGLPLGVELAQETVSECRIQLQAGQVLVMLTDGLLEAKNKAGEMFGFERFEQALSHAPREAVSSASAMQNHLLTALHNYITPVEPEDDVTVIVMSKH